MPKKPPKYPPPWPDFPLTVHPNGQYSKKIRGRVHYFGPHSNPDAAVALFLQQKDYLYAGQAPPVAGKTVADLLNYWLDQKEQLLATGELTQVSLNEYVAVSDVIADTLGRNRTLEGVALGELTKLRSALQQGKTKQLGVTTFKRRLTIARIVFKFSNDEMGTSIRYQKALAAPPKKLIRERRAAIGERIFSAKELRDLLVMADPHMTAVIYLGVNAAYGPADCVHLTCDKIVDGFINFTRPKTGVMRRCPLWPETLAAIEAIKGKTHVFCGRKWTRHVIARQFKELCETLAMYRENVTTPYSLRRTMQTVAKNAQVNQSCIDRIFGHERTDQSEVYNQRVFDKQLIRCTDFVRGWLLGEIEL